MTDIPTSIRLPAELKKYLQKVADSQRQKLSPFIIHILENWAALRKKTAREEADRE